MRASAFIGHHIDIDMRTFRLTSPNFTGHITYAFNADGYLIQYINEAELSEAQFKGLLPRTPLTVSDVQRLTAGTTGKLDEMPPDLSFTTFWAQIKDGKKINKKRCIPLFDKLNSDKKYLAIIKWNPYVSYCTANNRIIADPETYLKKEYFDNDWRR